MALHKGWTDTVDKAIDDERWDEHDKFIAAEVTDYNTRLATTKGYAQVDWKLIKAMLWTESGGPSNAAWKGRVLQIGNAGDKGWAALKAKEGAFSLVAPKDIADNPQLLKVETAKDNIRAAVAYLFTRMCISDIQRVDDPKDKRIYEYKFEASDKNFSEISKKLGTIPEVLMAMNPGKERALRAGLILKYVKAEKKRVITGWLPFTTIKVAERYNGGGDPAYSAKLDYVMSLFGKLKRKAAK
jgi:hypothetical protein